MADLALFLTIKTQPGKRDEMIALWDKHLRDRAAANASQIGYVIARDMNDENTVRITEIYADKAGFEANAGQPWFADYMAEVGPLLAGEPEFSMGLPHWIKLD